MDNLTKHHTTICSQCGEEIKRGIVFQIEHYQVCKHNAPNESIESHERWKESYNMIKQYRRQWESIWYKMSDEERMEYNVVCLSVSCFGNFGPDGNPCYWTGASGMSRIKEYENKMTEKYGK